MKPQLHFKLHTIFLLIFLVLLTIGSIMTFILLSNVIIKFLVFIFIIFAYIFLFLFLYWNYKNVRKEMLQIQDVFDFYSTKIMNELGVGLIIFNQNMKIIWFSTLIKQRFASNLLGHDIREILEKIFNYVANYENEVVTKKDNLYYLIKIDYIKKVIIINDITQSYLANQYYENEKLVLGLVDIDSYNQYQTLLEDEVVFKIDVAVTKVLDHLSSNYGVVYKKYGSGKFLLITNNSSLKKMEKIKFNFVKTLKKESKNIGIKISLSFGFGAGSTNYAEIEANARTAITQSHARGGDQITIVSSTNKQNVYYGGTSEAIVETSRVKIKGLADKLGYLIKKDTNISKVIITGHLNADLDAIGAALGLVALVRTANKEVYIANDTFDTTTKKAIDKWLSDEINLFIKPAKAKRLVTNKTLVIIVDTTHPSRIEAFEAVKRAKSSNIFIFDHHRVNKNISFKHNVEQIYIDTTASSTCEIITEIIRFVTFKVKIPKKIAQFMLSGIYLDTNNFQKSTSYKTYDAASWLEQHGAIPQESVNILKPDEEEANVILTIEKNVKEIKPGFVLSIYDGELEPHIIAYAANALLRIADRRASFVIAKIPNKNRYYLSARSIDVNVQLITELVGGGGHFSSAAAISEEPLDVFKDNLIQAIVNVRTNENNND